MVSGSTPSVGSGATPTTPTLPGLRPEIARIGWTLLGFSQDGTDYPDSDAPPITLRMQTDGATVSGSSGCNDYHGTYAAEGVALRIDLTGSSLIACADPIMARERAYLQALGSVAAYGFDYSELLLANADGRTILSFHGDPAPTPNTTPAPTPTVSASVAATASATSPLQPGVASRTWTLTRFSQDGRDIPLVANSPVTLSLSAQGAGMGGNAACNFYSGIYVVSGATLRLGLGSITEMRCSPARMLLQFEYLTVLRLLWTYHLEGGLLVLTTAAGRLQLIFRENPCGATASSQARQTATNPLSGTPWPATPCPSR
jgi:heat shock protein HslJ